MLGEPAFYKMLYARAAANEWDFGATRRDHELIVGALRKHLERGDVLDIGCGSGALLELLPHEFRRFGLEIGQAARKSAAARDIELVATSFEELSAIRQSFDAVIACDVIEHTVNPRSFIADAMKCLRPGGILILSTGNPSSWLWRICGGRFWYCQFAEHLTFVTPRWLAGQNTAGADLIDIQHFTYSRMSQQARLKVFVLLAFYLVLPSVFARWAARRRGWAGPYPYFPNPPGQGLTQDHLIAILRRTT